jgi:hypothetical protein
MSNAEKSREIRGWLMVACLAIVAWAAVSTLLHVREIERTTWRMWSGEKPFDGLKQLLREAEANGGNLP